MDPNTVTILRNPNAKGKKTIKELSSKSANSQYNGNSKKLDEEELPKLNLVGKDTGMKISQARLAKGYKQKDVAKFVLCSFWKGFTFEERFTVKDLRELCDEYEIEYSTDFWR